MKKITLSNLINLTEEDIRNIKPFSVHDIKIVRITIDNTRGIVEYVDTLYDLYKNKFKNNNFNYTLAVKGALRLVDKGIKFHNYYMDNVFDKIQLNSNDKIYLANLYVKKWYRNYMYIFNNVIIND
jgi:hypothetical protein